MKIIPDPVANYASNWWFHFIAHNLCTSGSALLILMQARYGQNHFVVYGGQCDKTTCQVMDSINTTVDSMYIYRVQFFLQKLFSKQCDKTKAL